MPVTDDSTVCTNCGAAIDPSGDTPESRVPCRKCGSTKRNYSVTVTDTLHILEGIKDKASRPGDKRPFVEVISAPEYSRSKKKTVHRRRIIDRDHDKYFEEVTDLESGEIIHRCKEPLTKHQGHGSVKKKKAPF